MFSTILDLSPLDASNTFLVAKSKSASRHCQLCAGSKSISSWEFWFTASTSLYKAYLSSSHLDHSSGLRFGYRFIRWQLTLNELRKKYGLYDPYQEQSQTGFFPLLSISAHCFIFWTIREDDVYFSAWLDPLQIFIFFLTYLSLFIHLSMDTWGFFHVLTIVKLRDQDLVE